MKKQLVKMVSLRTSSHDMEDASGRPRKMPRGPGQHDGGVGMPPIPINRGPSRGGPMGVGPPPTATSRRGGRTRARSPIVAGGGPGGRHPSSGEPGGRHPPGSVDRRGVKGENPSSAAAAAAAAAKAFSDNNHGPPGSGGRGSQWPPSDRHYDDRMYHQMGGYGDRGSFRGGHSKNGHSGGEDPRSSGGHGHYSQHTYNPYGGGYDGYPGDGYPHGDRRYRGGDRGGPTHYGHREGGYRGGPEGGRGPMYHPHHPEYHHRTYMGSSRGDPRGPPPPPPQAAAASAASAPSSPTKSNRGSAHASGNPGGTSLVIGGTTPIHVPKTEVHPEPAERPTRASTASVFRGRGNAESAPPDEKERGGEDNVQKNLLLSLKTPTTSFDEKKGGDAKRAPMSPKDPPQLHSTTQQRAVDMFERSPEAPKHSPSIDIAPSFTLFNQSFDLGDNDLGESYLESTLNAESFGMVRTGSTEPENVLRSAFSSGNASTQLLGPSASGQLTIDYSPVNSFGNVSAAPPRRSGSGGNMMLLGGPEARPSSPTQVLSTYSQGYGASGPVGNGIVARAGPLEDSHLRMSVGSFGAQSYGRAAAHYGGEPGYYPGGPGPEKAGDRTPPFYVFLRKYKDAFTGCAFLLPGLKAALLESSSSSDKSPPESPAQKKSPPGYGGDPSPHDIVIARRRVESSICAFGGSHSKDPVLLDSDSKPAATTKPDSSIFRGREKASPEEQKSATVTPSSSIASPPRVSSSAAKSKVKYEDELPGRYYENESRLSWEFEENPPIEVTPLRGPGTESNRISMGDRKEPTKSSDDASSKRIGASSPPASKMRYRCKLCGQPKQNHTCPYQQSLARSIGIMIFPAVNAFTAAEPGSIAPPLSEMNNFTDIQSEKGSVANESSPGRSSVPLTTPKQVTPESARASPRHVQLSSPPTTPGETPTRSNGMVRRGGGQSRGRKRPHGYEGKGPDEHGDLLFVEAMELKPQQFVSVSYDFRSPDAYSYPPLPLPYAQRKRLSDNLFSLSNEVPKLTDECAQVLREAREKDKWDLAVAQLMTQVVVVLHCREGDHRFEGLRQYLLTLGIAC